MKEEKNNLTNDKIDKISNDEFEIKELVGNSTDDLGSEEFSGSKRWYYKKNGTVYKICKDSDGILISYPGGSVGYGRGYTVQDVKSRHGLSGIRPYRSARSNSNC